MRDRAALRGRRWRRRGRRSCSTWPPSRSCAAPTRTRPRTFDVNVVGTGERAGGGASERRRARGRQRDDRQGLREPRDGEPAPRGRSARRQRSLQRQQGRLGAGRRPPTAQSFFSEQGSRRWRPRAPGNVIGGGDLGADRLVPDLVRAALERPRGRAPQPDAVRPWQHVLNPLSGYLVLAERCDESRESPRAWNFGPDAGRRAPVGWVAERLRELWGERARARSRTPASIRARRPYLRLDSAKARAAARLGARAGTSSAALAETVAWHQARRGRRGRARRDAGADRAVRASRRRPA